LATNTRERVRKTEETALSDYWDDDILLLVVAPLPRDVPLLTRYG